MQNSDEWLYSRQDLTGCDPAAAPPYPVVKLVFPSKEKAEAHAAKAREHYANDPNQLIRVRPCEGFSVVMHSLLDPDAKPTYRTYATRNEAKQQCLCLIMQPNVLDNYRVEVVPYVAPERKPERKPTGQPREPITIDAEEIEF